MLGYETNGASEEARDRDGWFVTGDRAILDKDAFLTITRPGAHEENGASTIEEPGARARDAT